MRDPLRSRLTKYTMSKRATAILDRQIEEARTLHPVAVKLAEVLEAALGNTLPDSPERARVEYTLNQVGDLFAPLSRYADLTESEVRRVLEALNLFDPANEVYRLIVGGMVVRTFLAKNRWHAVNHVRKHFGIEAAAYRYAGRHEVHAVSPVVEESAQADELVTVCGDCNREVPACVACTRGGATQADPHRHHECAPMHRRNARANA